MGTTCRKRKVKSQPHWEAFPKVLCEDSLLLTAVPKPGKLATRASPEERLRGPSPEERLRGLSSCCGKQGLGKEGCPVLAAARHH